MCSSPQWISPQISPFTTPHAWGLSHPASFHLALDPTPVGAVWWPPAPGTGAEVAGRCLSALLMSLATSEASLHGEMETLSLLRCCSGRSRAMAWSFLPCHPSCIPLLILVLGAGAAASCPSPSCLGSSPVTIRHFPVHFLSGNEKQLSEGRGRRGGLFL